MCARRVSWIPYGGRDVTGGRKKTSPRRKAKAPSKAKQKRATPGATVVRIERILERTLLGESSKEIAEAIGMSASRVRVLRMHDEYRKRYRETVSEHQAITREKLRALQGAAVDAYRDAMQPSEETKDRIQAANNVFDRTGHPKQTSHGVVAASISEDELRKMPTGQLADRIKELLTEIGDD